MLTRLCLLVLCTIGLIPETHGATFTVDTSSDGVLSDCDDAIAADCSLRGAIDRANAGGDADVIAFDLAESDAGYIAASAHWRIEAASALPLILQPLTIDGFTQAGSTPSAHAPLDSVAHVLKIEIRGPNNSSDGLSGFAPLVVRGLVLNHWRRAIFQFHVGPHSVEGCYIGTAVDGQTGVGNDTGITIGGDTEVGGPNPAQANVIASNRSYGINNQAALSRVRIQGNVIGLSADRASVPGRQDFGMYLLDPRDTLIGGSSEAESNTLAGHAFSALSVAASTFQGAGAPHLYLHGNRIGIGKDNRPFGNGISNNYPNITISPGGYCRAAIGGDAPGEGNVIAHGGKGGVAIGNCWGAPIRGNRFYGNRGPAIDLAGSNVFDGPTANDADDADAGGADPMSSGGGNRLQNFPQFALPEGFVENGGGASVQVDYSIDSATGFASYPLEVRFYRAGCSGGGVELIASDTYGMADAQSQRSFQLDGDGNVLPLTVLAEDAAGNTSEFSAVIGEALFVDGLEDDPASFSAGSCSS